MASNTMMTPLKEEVLELIRSAKKRGYVTHVQINELLSSEDVKSEQIEDILAMFSEMGVNVVETEEAEPKEEGARAEHEDEPGDEPEDEAKSEHGEESDVRPASAHGSLQSRRWQRGSAACGSWKSHCGSCRPAPAFADEPLERSGFWMQLVRPFGVGERSR